MSLAWQNIGKSLLCRAVIFDRRAITIGKGEVQVSSVSAAGAALAGLGTTKTKMRQPESVVAEGNVNNLLQHEVRDELKKRGVSAIGKPWEIKNRLQELLDAERLLPGAKSDGDEPTPQEHAAIAAQQAPSVRDKYANKMSAKLSATLARKVRRSPPEVPNLVGRRPADRRAGPSLRPVSPPLTPPTPIQPSPLLPLPRALQGVEL
eukprot:1012943-Prymnesium_polylepis.1